MIGPLDSTDSPEMHSALEEIVRAAVVYGFLRGSDRAFASARPSVSGGPASATRTDSLRTRIARQVAEEFLRKVYAEQLIR